VINIPDDLTMDEAADLQDRIRRAHPRYKRSVGFGQSDFKDPFSPFVVTAWMPGYLVFYNVQEYEAWKAAQ
jgi:hypothetical protein